MERYNNRLFIDADSCPVKEEVLQLGEHYQIPLLFVSSYAHQLQLPAWVKKVTVDADKEAVDLYILNQARPGDLCVTQDHALASVLLAKRVIVLSPRGDRYEEGTISQLLDARYVAQKRRRMGKKTKGPKAFTAEDRQRFLNELKSILIEQTTEKGKENK